LIFFHVSTYALSSTVLPVVQKTGVPGVVLSLQLVLRLTMRSSTRWAIVD
jgi:hypothetical protein